MKELEWSQDFPHYNPMGAIYCHGNQSSYPILPKTLCNQSPTPMMLLIKFDYDWPAGFRHIHVWKCERTDARTPARVPYYNLTLSLRLLWAKKKTHSYLEAWHQTPQDTWHVHKKCYIMLCMGYINKNINWASPLFYYFYTNKQIYMMKIFGQVHAM